jgi:hypothetical protein
MLERSREETQQENATRECNKRMQQEIVNASRGCKRTIINNALPPPPNGAVGTTV